MSVSGKLCTTVSTKDGLLPKAAPVFLVTRPEDVFACLAYDGPPKTLEDMDAAVLGEAGRQHDALVL